MLQIVVSLAIVIYYRYIFMVQATGVAVCLFVVMAAQIETQLSTNTSIWFI